MKSKFQREQRTKIFFQIQKGFSLALHMRVVGTYGASWKEEWVFYEMFNESAKIGHKNRERGR